MRMTKKITAVLLTVIMIASVFAVCPFSAAADSYETYAQDTVQGSNILHCFDWSYNNIKAKLPEIAAAGYTAVQTSPVQRPKDYSASWTDGVNQWWKMYQPLGLSIAADNTSWLGTKSELTSLCSEADNYDIKVIVDIVANHLANNGTSGGGYALINTGIDEDLKKEAYFHSSTNGTNDDSRYNITQYHLGMPDLNTGNSTIQQKTLALLKECIDCGVDGFRFDAAKHIEVPADDASFASRFWPTVIDGAKDYTDNDLFFYGEILGSAGIDIGNYTTYMAVTDNYTGDRALDKAFWSAASELADGTYYKGASASKSVLWVESHDTYMGKSGSAYFTNTKDVTSDVLNKAWAIVGARANSTGLFFARPNSTMGAASSDTNWKSDAVAEVNKFKNHFDGTSEYLASSGSTAYIERGTKGVVISKLDGSGSVSLTAHQMKSGTYTDQITGSTFTVSNGKITGTVGSTGVAVVYNASDDVLDYITASTLYLKPNSNWNQASARFAMYVYNSVTGSNQWVSMTSAGSGYYSAAVPSGSWTNVIFCRMNPSSSENRWDAYDGEGHVWNQTNNLFPDDGTNCYTVASGAWSSGDGTWSAYGTTPTAATESSTTAPTSATEATTATEASGDTYTIYAINNASWSKVNIYWWDSNTACPADYPGTSMTSFSGTKVYTYNIPKDAGGILFTNGTSSKQTEDIISGIADGAVFMINSTTNNGKYTTSAASDYYLVGTMNSWTNNDSYKFSIHAESGGKLEYKLSGVQLAANAEFKVHSSSDSWYPSGNNHTVTAAGTYDIYFRPNGDGGGDWLSDSGNTSKKYVYLKNVTPYTVTWKNGNTTLKTDTVIIGNTPEYTGVAPTQDSTQQYDYTFDGWTTGSGSTVYTAETLPAVTADVTYTAHFAETLRTFTVTWKNYDGTTLETDENVVYGSIPSYDGATPERESEGSTTYAFSGWSPQITTETRITSDTTYTARFSANTKAYTITWKDGDGNIIRTETCIEGVTPQYIGEDPTKTATAQYTYTFNHTWDPPLVAADRDTVYTAQFDSAVNKYTITWKDGDGVTLKTEQVEYGITPAYSGTTPTKAADANYTYAFNNTWSPAIAPVTAAATYTAQFDSTPIPNITVRATNVVEWTNVYLYYWTNFGDNAWPGVRMTPDEDSFIWSAEIPANAKGIIFTNGASTNTKQTVNIESGIKDGAHWAILNEKDSTETSKYKVHAVSTYYLVGTMTDWKTDNAPVFIPHKASAKVEEYKLTTALSKDAQIKVYGSDDKWYPNGDDNNYTITSDGTYSVYFRPNADGGSTWHQNVFYVKNVTPYTITWKDGDGNTLKTDTVTYGDTPAYTGATPTKTATAQYTYTFNNTWSPTITAATADATYTAQFGSTVNTYTVTWKNDDGTVLETDENVPYGTTPTYDRSDPVKAATEEYSYQFSGWTPAVSSVKKDTEYTAVYSETVLVPVKLDGHTLSLEGDIGVNFYMELNNEVVQSDTAIMRFTIPSGSSTTISSIPIKSITPISLNKKSYYVFKCNVSAKDMTSVIRAQIVDDGVEVGDEFTYSVKDYADYLLSHTGDNDLYADAADLVKTMLNYGAYAQIYFGNNTDNLANDGLTDAQKSLEGVTAAVINKTDYSAQLPAGVDYKGATLSLKSMTTLSLYFESSETLSFSCSGNKTVFTETRDGYQIARIRDIAPNELDDDFTLTVTAGENSGTITYSPMHYCYQALNGGTDKESLQNVVKALYKYNQAADSYFD